MKRRVGFGAFPRALGIALQWKLLLLWFLVTLVPALVAARPIHGLLSSMMDHSVHAAAWAKSFNALAMTDVLVHAGRHDMPMIGTSIGLGLIITLLLSPFLTGMSVTAVRSAHHPGFGELMHGGIREYWRLFRYMLWAVGLLGIAFALGHLANKWAAHQGDLAVLESKADFYSHVATFVLIVLLVVAHSMIEAGRGQIVANADLRSATKAFFRGIGTLFKRPLATLGMYLGVSVIGYVLVLLLGMWRLRVVAAGWGGFLLALVVTVLVIVAMAWMRTARLAAFGSVAQASSRDSSAAVAPA